MTDRDCLFAALWLAAFLVLVTLHGSMVRLDTDGRTGTSTYGTPRVDPRPPPAPRSVPPVGMYAE